MIDMTLSLYRKWYRSRHPLQEPLRPNDAQMPRSRRVKAALDKGDFETAEAWAESLLAFPPNEQEDEVFKGLHALLAWLRTYAPLYDILTLLTHWQEAYPASRWPALIELMYWGQAASERRGQDVSSAVSETQWQDAWVIGQVFFLKGLSLLGQGMDWFIAHELTMHAQIFHEPEWCKAWCYGQAVAAEDIPEQEELIKLASPVLLDRWGFAQIKVPALPAERPAVLIPIAQRVSPDDPDGFFWLMVGLSDSPYGFYLIKDYAFLRTERWGGDDNEILSIASSDLCKHLTDEERQQIRSIQWEDEVSSLVFDDPEIKDIDKRARKALKRGDLSTKAHSQMLEWIHVRLHIRWPKLMRRTPLYRWRLYHSLKKMMQVGIYQQNDWKFSEALRYQCIYGHFPEEMTAWLVPMCYYSALHAAIYGIFCDNGWGGLKQDHALAREWYAYATRLQPAGSVSGDMTNGLFTQLQNECYWGWDDYCGPLWNLILFLAEAGYADAQNRIAGLYGEDERHRDLSQSVKWYRAALRSDQPDTYRALYYLGKSYIGEMKDVDPTLFPKTTPLSRAAYGMDAFLAFLERMATHPVATWTAAQADFVDRALVALRYTIAVWTDLHAEYLQPILHLLTRYADTLGIVGAKVAIAYIWNYLPSDADWLRAARLIIQLHQQYPDREEVTFVYDAIRNKGGAAEFDQIAATMSH